MTDKAHGCKDLKFFFSAVNILHLAKYLTTGPFIYIQLTSTTGKTRDKKNCTVKAVQHELPLRVYTFITKY